MRASKAGRQGHPLAATILAGALALLAAIPLMAANGAPSTPTRPPALPVEDDPGAAAHPLIEMLSFVPNTPEHRDLLTWGDATAWYEATGVPRVANIDQIDTLPDEQRELLLFDLISRTTPPDALGIRSLYTEDLRARYGFDLFAADQMLGAGQPPDSLAVVTVDIDPAAIDTALSRTGYTTTQVSGGVLYSLRGDYEFDLRDESPTGRLGALNRIAVIEGEDGPTVLIGRATAVVEAALAAHSGDSPALADDPLYRFVAETLTDGTFDYLGELVGLIFVEPQPVDPLAALGMAGENVQEQLEGYLRQPMPPTLLHAFATFRDGSETVLMLVALLPTYFPADQAEAAAALLYDRLDGYASVTGATLEDRWAREAYGTLIADPLRAAYVTMRLTDAPENRFNWMQMIANRDLLFLTPGTEP